MSGNMDQVPKPGSILSLISKSQVRYEGVLDSIDMKSAESSITLSDGTSARHSSQLAIDRNKISPQSSKRLKFTDEADD